MRARLLSSVRKPWVKLIAVFDDSAIDEDLLRHTVDSLFASPASLFASIVMGAAITCAACLMTREPIFFLYASIHIACGICRTALVSRYAGAPHDHETRGQVLDWDRRFLFWSTAFAANVGMMNYSLSCLPRDSNVAALAMAVTVGYSMAFVSRSSARLELFLVQVLALTAPMIFGYATLPIVNGRVYAFLLVGLLACTIIMAVSAHAKNVELFRANEKTRLMARTDMLTGLMNRFSFSEALSEILTPSAQTPVRPFAVITVDLDRFKEINDTLGHNVGDAVIVEMSARLRAVVRTGDIVARLGGDEFVILSKRSPDEPAFGAEIASRIVDALAIPIALDLMTLPTSASVGVALFPDHGSNAEELMKKADIALYEAKHAGRNTASVFDAFMQAKINDSRMLELEMQTAIVEHQFVPWFQLIQNIETGFPSGYEALARWFHPVHGMIPPNQFIPLAEQNGSILQIGEQILEQACRAAASWPRHLTVAVNLSPVQFRRPQKLVDTVKSVLLRTKLDPARLYLEITESLLMEDTPQTRAAITELAGLGVRFSLDDFGAGYSSLSYIQDYPFSKIKIDKKFIDRIDTDKTSSAIVAAVSVLAARIHLDIVAEGVETPIQHATLRSLGLTEAQGYYYGRPAADIAAGPRLALIASA